MAKRVARKKLAPKPSAAERFARNIRRLREEKYGSVFKACQASGYTIPRWYRMEQGTYPGMVGVVLDEMAALFGVEAESLLR